jgi:nitrous oxidase accessory protein NosD
MKRALFIIITLFAVISLQAQVPVTTGPVTYAPKVFVDASTISPGSPATVTVPVTVDNFANVGTISLKLGYDMTVLTYAGYTSPVIPGLTITPGVGFIKVGWFGNTPAPTLPPGGVLLNLEFTMALPGTSLLTWIDDDQGAACEYGEFPNMVAFNDLPYEDYWKNGWVTTMTLGLTKTDPVCPAITGSIEALAQYGSGTYIYSIDGVNFSSPLTPLPLLFNTLAPGSYTVTARDAVGAEVTATTTLAITGGYVLNINTSEQFCSIQAAIDAPLTQNGHTLMVSSGTYTENITIDKELTIMGDLLSPIPAIIDGGSNGGVVSITADNVTFWGFVVRNSGAGINDAGISITNASNVLILTNQIFDNSNGIIVWNTSSTVPMSDIFINDNFITDNDHDGIRLDGTDGAVVNNLNTVHNILENNFIGIRFIDLIIWDNVTITNDVMRNNQQGMQAQQATTNTPGTGTITVTDCDISANQIGINIETGDWVISGNEIYDNTEIGILVKPVNSGTTPATVTIDDNGIEAKKHQPDSYEACIKIDDLNGLSDVDITGNRISIDYALTYTPDPLVPATDLIGVWVTNGAEVSITGNDIKQKKHQPDSYEACIKVDGANTVADISTNTIESWGRGILMESGASGSIGGNTITVKKHQPDSYEYGIRIKDLNTAADISYNIIELDYATTFTTSNPGCEYIGISVSGGATATIDQNRVEFKKHQPDSYEYCIKLEDLGTFATITGNTLIDGNTGIAVLDGANAEIEDNDILNKRHEPDSLEASIWVDNNDGVVLINNNYIELDYDLTYAPVVPPLLQQVTTSASC